MKSIVQRRKKSLGLSTLLYVIALLIASSPAVASIPHSSEIERLSIERYATEEPIDRTSIDNRLLLHRALARAMPLPAPVESLSESRVWDFSAEITLVHRIERPLTRALRRGSLAAWPEIAANRTVLTPDPIGYEDSSNLYAYGAADPVNNRDPRGEGITEWWNRNFDELDEEGWKEFRGFLSGSIGTLPIAGEITDAVQAVTGYDFIAGEKLAPWEQAIAAGSILVPLGGARVARKAIGATANVADEALNAAADAGRALPGGSGARVAAAPAAQPSPSNLHRRGRKPDQPIVISASDMQATLKSVRRHVDKLNKRGIGEAGQAFQRHVAAGEYGYAGTIAHNRMFKRLRSRTFQTLEGNEVFINTNRIYPPPSAAPGVYSYRLPDVQYGVRGTAEYRVWDFKGYRPTSTYPDPTGQFGDIRAWTGADPVALYYHWWR